MNSFMPLIFVFLISLNLLAQKSSESIAAAKQAAINAINGAYACATCDTEAFKIADTAFETCDATNNYLEPEVASVQLTFRATREDSLTPACVLASLKAFPNYLVGRCTSDSGRPTDRGV